MQSSGLITKEEETANLKVITRKREFGWKCFSCRTMEEIFWANIHGFETLQLFPLFPETLLPCTLLSLPFSPLLFGEFQQLCFAFFQHTSPCFCPIFPVQCKGFNTTLNSFIVQHTKKPDTWCYLNSFQMCLRWCFLTVLPQYNSIVPFICPVSHFHIHQP